MIVDALDTFLEQVEEEHADHRNANAQCRRIERRTDALRHLARIGHALHRQRLEGVDDAQDGAQQAQQRGGRHDGIEDPQALLHFAALGNVDRLAEIFQVLLGMQVMLLGQDVRHQGQRQAGTGGQFGRQFLQVLDRVRHGALQARGLAHGVAEEQAAFDDDENGQRRAGVHQVEGQFVE